MNEEQVRDTTETEQPPARDAAMGRHGFREMQDTISVRLERLRVWCRRMAYEVAELPDTMQRIREGSKSFKQVAERLDSATSSLEEITSVYQSTISDSTRRTADAAAALRKQIDSLTAGGSPDRMSSTLSDIQKSMETIAQLNPLWPRPKRQ